MTTTPKPAPVTVRGLCNVSYFADDVSAAARWYADAFGVEPYFARPEAPEPPAYVEFRLGDAQDELGIVDRRFAAAGTAGDGGVVVHWHVDDLPAAYQAMCDRGAQPVQPPTERGAGFVTAAVRDPFGNVLGLMYSPHFAASLT